MRMPIGIRIRAQVAATYCGVEVVVVAGVVEEVAACAAAAFCDALVALFCCFTAFACSLAAFAFAVAAFSWAFCCFFCSFAWSFVSGADVVCDVVAGSVVCGVELC